MRIILTSFEFHSTGGIRTRQGKVGVVLSGKRQRSEKAVRESSSNLLGESQFEIRKVANPWCEIPRYTFYYPGENKNRAARLCRDPLGRGVALHPSGFCTCLFGRVSTRSCCGRTILVQRSARCPASQDRVFPANVVQRLSGAFREPYGVNCKPLAGLY